MAAPGVISEIATVCTEVYVPPGTLNVGMAAGGRLIV
jgi:hypothetical protein